MRRIVVVGYGVAGLTAADTLRDEGFDGELIIVGSESRRPYSRPALSKALLGRAEGSADTTLVDLPSPRHDAQELLGSTVVGLDPERRTLRLSDGRSLDYDGLVIATGAQSRRLTDNAEEFVLRSLAEAVALRRRLDFRPQVTILGGGPLGMEVASSARELGCEVTLVHPGLPMRRQLGSHLAQLCVRAGEDRGVTFLDDRAEAAKPLLSSSDTSDPHAGFTVQLRSGRRLETEVLVSAIGEDPCDRWLGDSGLLTEGRLLADEQGRVAPGIVAAGDVAWTGTAAAMRRTPLWMTAIEQAKSAARTLLQGEGDAAAPPGARRYFWTEQFGLRVRVCGETPDGEPVVVDGDPAEPRVLLHWPGDPEGREFEESAAEGTAATVNYRYPIPRLRRLAATPRL